MFGALAMKGIMLTAALFLGALHAARADTAYFVNGWQLVFACAGHKPKCEDYVRGQFDMMMMASDHGQQQHLCITHSANIGQLTDAIVRYSFQHPEWRDQ